MPHNTSHNINTHITDKFDTNATHYAPYYFHQFYLFTELSDLINECIDCLVFELHQACICTTNHLLERALKHALIIHYTHDYPIGRPEATTKSFEAIQRFDNLTLSQSIQSAKEYGLISEQDQSLLNALRKHIRNPYSHATIAKIAPNTTQTSRGYLFNFEATKAAIRNQQPPTGRLVQISNYVFAQRNQAPIATTLAPRYFKTVHYIMRNMDNAYKHKFNIQFPP